MSVVQLTGDNINQVVNDRDTVIIDFWASWCGPCRAFKPIFEAAAVAHPEIVFAACDTEAEDELAATLGIRSIPTVMVFREGVLVFAQPGLLPTEAVEELLHQVKALDMDEVHARITQGRESAAAGH